MQTYAEMNGENTFNWNEFLNRPKKEIFGYEWDDASSLASSWVTCACGNQCDILPRNREGAPTDGILSHLGIKFMVKIDNRQRKKALEVLQKIEERSTLLIRELIQQDGQTPQEEQSV